MKLKNRRTAKSTLLASLAALLLFAQPAAAQEKRFLVRYDHGSANLAPWAGLKLYVGSERVRIFVGNDLIHDIPVASITRVTHELRSPFDPAKTTERVFNDTIGACSNIPDCAVLGAAGVVGAAGVGVAILFTPKEYIITLNWLEGAQPRELAMKIAWYQKIVILDAFKKYTGHAATERLPGKHAPVTIAPSAPPAAQTSSAASPSISPAHATPDASVAVSVAPQTQTIAVEVAPPAAPESHELIRRFGLVLDRPARVGDSLLQPGFYLVLVQERANSKAMVVFLDVTVQNSPTTKILAKAFADLTDAPNSSSIQPLFAGEGDAVRLVEIRLPARTLKFNDEHSR